MSKELLGGERVKITHQGNVVQTFERTMSEERLEHLLKVDPPEGFIDLWRLATPMSAKQKQHLSDPPKLDLNSSAEDQTRQIWDRIENTKRRERITGRTKDVLSADGKNYELGNDIHPVAKALLWEILDGLARAGENEIEAAKLDYFITYRRGDRG